MIQEKAFWAVRHKDPKQRELIKKFLKTLCPSESSKVKLKKFLQRIERHGEKGHLMKQTFSNKSCHEELKDWYESTNLTINSYTKYLSRVLGKTLQLPKNSESLPNPIEEWWLNTGGHLY
jgi:ribosomal protein L16 Arg81 hydroxylase